ncbi:MAG TPA: hypothetical protein DCW72_10410 [Elusimicrobia bacterium]|nr:MAG: hypothetical protein A2X29_06605 [Elusimicrobia bacterium GWA2_64_40]OGR65766.1 MAG: hypothetical protein A2X30_02525 [Elusimicrobia bacterium GWB2_63_16]HAN04973.1 hypothetical protein [Elusimicrobiota bacterium]HAU90593.1 hypothetical protein [Elusimicrobiota bacterium]
MKDILTALGLCLGLCGAAGAFDLAGLDAAAVAGKTAEIPAASKAYADTPPSRGVSAGVRQALAGSTFECRRFQTLPFTFEPVQIFGVTAQGVTIEKPDRLTVSFPEVSEGGIIVRAVAVKNGTGTLTKDFRIVQDVQEKYSFRKVVVFEGNNIGLNSALNNEYAVRTELHLHLDSGNNLVKISLEKGVFSGINPLQKNEFTCEL